MDVKTSMKREGETDNGNRELRKYYFRQRNFLVGYQMQGIRRKW